MCGDWPAWLGWLHILSDLTTFAAYVAIPVSIFLYVRARSDVPLRGLFLLFSAFIFSCGCVHLFDALMFWWPAYPILGLIKLATALISAVTVVALIRALPVAVRLPGLAMVNARLEQEVEARTASEERLRDQRQELQRINRQLEQFAYIASHDLLEPLRKVRFFADVVRDEAEGQLSADADDAIKRLGRAVERMNRLIRDLLTFARAGRTIENCVPVEFDAVVAEAMEQIEPAIQASQARIDVQPIPAVMGDRLLLVQVMQNILANAIRYRHPDRPVMVTISGRRSGAHVVIAIADQGIGFDPSASQRLFEPFVRLHSGGPDEGSGIGLAICARIVQALRGTITADGRPGGGATFAITLPAASLSHEAEA